jgi:hypothetical protein
MMLDGMELHGRTKIVVLGISTEGEKLALGLWDGSTENGPSPARCWPTSSTVALTSNRGCCS